MNKQLEANITADVPTLLKPEAKVVLSRLAVYLECLRAGLVEGRSESLAALLPTVALFTSLGAVNFATSPTTRSKTEPLAVHPNDLDLAVRPVDMSQLRRLATQVSTESVSYVPESLTTTQPIEGAIFAGLVGQQFSYQVRIRVNDVSWVYGVDVFDNHRQDLLEKLLQDAEFLTKEQKSFLLQHPCVKINGLEVWHPALMFLFFTSLTKSCVEDKKVSLRPQHFKHRLQTMKCLRVVLEGDGAYSLQALQQQSQNDFEN